MLCVNLTVNGLFLCITNYWRKHRAAQSRSGGQEDILLQDLANITSKASAVLLFTTGNEQDLQHCKEILGSGPAHLLAHYSPDAVLPNTLTVHFSFLLRGVTGVAAAAVQIHRSITKNGAESAVL